MTDASTLLPGAAYERDPTLDYQIHKALLYTMATCHSLRNVDGELIGDPLDVKMFDFTRWSFEESMRKPTTDSEQLQGAVVSIARPPAGMEYGMDKMDEDLEVSCLIILRRLN